MKDVEFSFKRKKKKQLGSTVCKLGVSMLLMMSMVAPNMTYVSATETMTSDPQISEEKKAQDVASRAADTTKPVIEEVVFPGHGKTVSVGTELPITVKAYDADSNIKTVKVGVYYEKPTNSEGTYENVTLTYNSATGLYEGKILALNGGYVSAEISSLEVEDAAYNYVRINRNEQENKFVYDFKIQGGVEEKHNINKVEIDKNQQMVGREDTIAIKIYVNKTETENMKEMNVNFELEQGGQSISFSLTKNSNLSTATENVYVSDSNHYFGTDPSGKWKLSHCYAYSEDSRVRFDYAAKDQIWFMLDEKQDSIKPTITSIEMDHVGKMLKSGDKAEIRVKATDNEGLSRNSAYAYFRAAADISYTNDSKYLTLEYLEATDEYVGTLLIDDDTYPCEWVLSSVSIYDTSSNVTSLSDFVGNTSKAPYYVQVTKDGSYVNPTYNARGSFSALDEYGNVVQISSWSKDKVERRTSLKDLGITFPRIESAYKGLKFVGWIDREGNPVDDSEIVTSEYQNFQYFAKYDKLVLNITYSYPDENLDYQYTSENKIVPYGTTYADVLSADDMMKTLKPYKGEGFDGWQYSQYSLPNGSTLDDEIKSSAFNNLNIQPIYKNSMPILKQYSYIDKDANYASFSKVVFVKKGTTYETIKSQFEQDKAPNSLEGLRFSKWDVNLYHQEGEIKNSYTSVYASALYENCFVKFLVDDQFKPKQKGRAAGGGPGYDESKVQSRKVVIAELNETITIPEFPEYQSIVWVSNKNIVDGKLKVTGNQTIYGYGVKEGEPSIPETPETPEEPSAPETPEEPTTPEIPSTGAGGIQMDKEQINNVVNSLQGALPGTSLDVSMGDATVVPKDILETIKGKNVVVNLNMGGYTWSINGNDILSADLQNINLEVSFDQNIIPSNTIKNLAGDNPIKQLSLTHNGDFGFKANLSFNIGSEYTGKYGNLYYYDSDGKLVYMNAGKISDTGDVSLSFSHASEYVIVINDKVMEEKADEIIKDTGRTSNASNVIMGGIILAGAYFAMKKKDVLIKECKKLKAK